jgi:hypothetical protein
MAGCPVGAVRVRPVSELTSGSAMMPSQFASSSLVAFGSDCFWAGFAGLCGFLASAAAVNVAAMIRVPINALRLQRKTRDLELILSPVVNICLADFGGSK